MMEKAKPKGVYCNLKNLIGAFPEIYWNLDLITRRHKGNLDKCWVTLPYLDKLSLNLSRLIEVSEDTLKEIRQKSEEFRVSILSGLEEKDIIKE